MTRNTRKRKNAPEQIRSTSIVSFSSYSIHSSSWYVGYAEDGESVEAIMKKFEQLEQLQKEVAEQQINSSSISCTSSEMNTHSTLLN